jgi:hypothetical protein
MDRVKAAKEFDDFCRELKEILRQVPPNSRFSLEIVTNAAGEIHNHRITTVEDKGPLSLRLH